MKHRIPPKPEWFDTVPEGTCRWCGEEVGLTKTGRVSKSRWHPICFEEYELLFWSSATRKAVWKRDKGVCASCSTQCEKKGKNGWDLDHKIPLIEGDGSLTFWQMGNLQTLCKQCHKDKTGKEATERALKRKEMKAQELFEAPSTDLATQAGLINFLTSNGFKSGGARTGEKQYSKSSGAKKAVSALKKIWKVEKTNTTDYGVTSETLENSGVKIRLSMHDDGYTYITWQIADFKSVDKTNIYNVTKYHPAWAYVLDYMDNANSRSKETKKNAVDAYMQDNDLTSEQLKAIIVKRTREGKVHSLYGTD